MTFLACRGQGEALNIDRRDMYARLYACIPELALLPLHSDDGSLDDLLSQGDLFLCICSSSALDLLLIGSQSACGLLAVCSQPAF